MKQIRPEGQLSIGEIFAQLATLIKPAPGKTYDYADLKARCNAKQLTEEERTEEEPVLYIGHTARTLFKRTNWKTFLTEDTLCDILAYYIHQQTPSAFINFPNADIKSAIVFGWTGIDPDFIDKGEASMFDTPHSFYRHEDKEIGVAHLIPPIMGFGVWALFVGQVNMAVALVTSIALGIIVDDTVHFLTKYIRARRQKGYDAIKAVRYSLNTVGMALTVTTIVLVSGFIILTFSVFKVNSDFGIITALTITIALAIDLLLLPSLLIMLDKDKK